MVDVLVHRDTPVHEYLQLARSCKFQKGVYGSLPSTLVNYTVAVTGTQIDSHLCAAAAPGRSIYGGQLTRLPLNVNGWVDERMERMDGWNGMGSRMDWMDGRVAGPRCHARPSS